jgi:hypothetical protein
MCFKEKSLYYFHKILKILKTPKKQNKTFLVGFRWFFGGFLGTVVWVVFLLPTLAAGAPCHSLRLLALLQGRAAPQPSPAPPPLPQGRFIQGHAGTVRPLCVVWGL